MIAANPVRDVVAVGAASVRRAAARPTTPKMPEASRVALEIRTGTSGNVVLIYAETGELFTQCATREIAQRTREAFAP